MKKHISIVLLFCTTAINTSYSQNYTPIDLAKKIFGKKSFPNIRNYITGEYQGHPNGKDFPNNSTINYRLLSQTNKQAAVAMTVLSPKGNGVDIYLYFKKDAVWKMYSIRSLAMTGMIAYEKKVLEKLTLRQVDSIILAAKNDTKNEKSFLFRSIDEFDFMLGNSKLMTSLDDKLIDYFKENKVEFERIKEAIIKEKQTPGTIDNPAKEPDKDLKEIYRKLYISNVPLKDYNFKNCIEFVIGGMVDNFAGYVYVPDRKDLPVISDDHIIMLREIGNGWYLYKTT